MSTLISPEYQRLNRILLKRVPGYGRGGYRHASVVAKFAQALGAQSILDYGCGQGTLKAAMFGQTPWRFHGGRVYEYDPAIPRKSAPPTPRDLVVCTDVLEHVEPDKLAAVLADLRRVTLRGCYVVIATRSGNKILPDGRDAHLIVQPSVWWISRVIEGGWTVLGARRWYERAGTVKRLGIRYTIYSDVERGVTLWLQGGS